MQPPRMNVAVYGRSAAGAMLADALATAGHHLTAVPRLEEATAADAVVLAVHEGELEASAEILADAYAEAPRPAKRPLVIHTCLGQGVQVLDAVEVTGAIVLAASPLSSRQWAVTALDEPDYALADVLASESHAQVCRVAEGRRGLVAACQEYAELAALIAQHADELLGGALEREPDPDISYVAPGQRELDARAIADAYEHVADPQLARGYVDAARRCGEITGNEELEMWAVRKASR